MPNTLIVPIDFSKYSEQQLLIAKTWSIWLKANVLVVHQMNEKIPSLVSDTLRIQIRYENERKILQDWFHLKEKIFDQHQKVSFEITNENLIHYLIEKTQGFPEGIIILGLKGTSKLKQIFIGSTVTDVIGKVNLPVIAVPQMKFGIIPKKLIISAHPKYPFNIGSLKNQLKKIKGMVEEIKMITFSEENDELINLQNHLDMLKSKMETEVPISTKIFTVDKFKDEAFQEFEGTKDCYLILQKGGRTFIDNIFRKFHINELVYRGSLPLIILP